MQVGLEKNTNFNPQLLVCFVLFFFLSLWPIEQPHSMVLHGVVCIVGLVKLEKERTQNTVAQLEPTRQQRSSLCVSVTKKEKEENRRLQRVPGTGIPVQIIWIIWILWVPLVRYPLFDIRYLGLPAWIIYDIQGNCYFWILIPLLLPHCGHGSTKSLIRGHHLFDYIPRKGNRAQLK